jgi:hypothetical protein
MAMAQPERASAQESAEGQRDGAGAVVDLGPFTEERDRIDRITSRLGETQDMAERADLGTELVRSVSRYEDTFERVLVPRLGGLAQAAFKEQASERKRLREAMDEIHQRTMGIDARNVHASDGQGFEDALTAVVTKVQALFPAQDREIATLVGSLGTDDRLKLSEEVAHAFRSASERPYPPRTAVGRILSNAHVKLDHTFEDVATPHHPGAKTIKG